MPSRAQHYREAEKLLDKLADRDNYRHDDDGYFDTTQHDTDKCLAQIHATLANAHREVGNLALDLEHTEPASMEQRQWLIEPEPHEATSG